MAKRHETMSLIDAAMRLGRGYHATRDLLLRGELRGGRDKKGRLFFYVDDVERLAASRQGTQRQPQVQTA